MISRGAFAVALVIIVALYIVAVEVTSKNNEVNWYPMPAALWLTVVFVALVAVGAVLEISANRAEVRAAKAAAAPRATSQRRQVYMVAPGIYEHGRMTAHLNIRTGVLKVEWSESGAEAGKLVPSKSGFDAYDADGNSLGWVKDKTEGMEIIERSAP